MAARHDPQSLDASALAAASGWTVVHRNRTRSTNDDAAFLRAAGAPARTVVVADEQQAGRGREGRAFASPRGGLYASLLLPASPEDLPGPVVAAVALAVADALQGAGAHDVALKWPNDLWLSGRKVGGILLEGPGGPQGLVVAGIGLNLVQVPSDLPDDLRSTLCALEPHVGRPVSRDALLTDLLRAADARLAALRTPAARASLAQDYAGRQALQGAQVTWTEGSTRHAGRLLHAGLDGLEVEQQGRRRRVRIEHAMDLRPA
ncbi:MAG: biotin--[acetyl-CoA-carboxylase] ligase [Planctomycetia bacterium]